MKNPFKKRPGTTLVMIIAGLYLVVIAGWAGFIIVAKTRNTTKLTHEEATELYHKCQLQKAAQKDKIQ